MTQEELNAIASKIEEISNETTPFANTGLRLKNVLLPILNDLFLKISEEYANDTFAKLSDVYSKTRADELFARISEVYTKEQANDLLNNKANTADVYTKRQANELLAGKANTGDVYTKEQADEKFLLNDLPNSSNTQYVRTYDSIADVPLYSLIITENGVEKGQKWTYGDVILIKNGDSYKILVFQPLPTNYWSSEIGLSFLANDSGFQTFYPNSFFYDGTLSSTVLYLYDVNSLPNHIRTFTINDNDLSMCTVEEFPLQTETAKGVKEVIEFLYNIKANLADVYTRSEANRTFAYKGQSSSGTGGSSNPDDIIFDENFIVTESIGAIEVPENETVTLEAEGRSLCNVLRQILTKEKTGVITQPSLTISAPQNKSYEVGTKVTPTYTLTFDKGSYQYGPADTGVEIDSIAVTDTYGNTLTTLTGEFPRITVDDNTNYRITADVTYSDGDAPLTNLGNEQDGMKIQSDDTSVRSNAITGYRASFYGVLTSKKDSLTSADIRKLTKSNKRSQYGDTFEVELFTDTLQVVIAIPVQVGELRMIQDYNDSMTNLISSFTLETIQVNDASGANAIDYNVYTLKFAAAYGVNNKYIVTI